MGWVALGKKKEKEREDRLDFEQAIPSVCVGGEERPGNHKTGSVIGWAFYEEIFTLSLEGELMGPRAGKGIGVV